MPAPANGAAEPWSVEDWLVDDRGTTTAHPEPLEAEPVGATAYVEPATDTRYDSGASYADEPAGETAGAAVSGRALIVLTAAAAAACVLVNLWLTDGRLTFFFDLCFVVICLVAAMAVRIGDLFTAGVLPPLLFAGVIAIVSVVAPNAFESSTGVDRVFLTGLASHASGLVAAYAVALGTIAARTAASRR